MVDKRIKKLRDTNQILDSEIAGRSKAEHALRISEANQTRLLESTNVIPWEADAKTWMFTYVGPQAEKLLGYPCKQWLEKDFWIDHLHPEDRTWAPNYCAKALNEIENYEFEYRMIGNADQIVWIHDIVNVISKNGDPAVLQGFLIDISERRKVEQALKDSELRYRTIIETTLDAILVTDADGKIVFANSAAVDQFAADSVDQLIGLNMITLVHPKDRNNVERRRRRVLQGGVPPFAERTRLRLNGSEFLSQSRGVPIPWEGEPAILIVVRDVTQLKRSGEILQNLSARLINAHEDERSRIARELHDDFSQSLAILTVDMELCQKRLSDSQKSVADFLALQVQRMKDLSSKLQLLSRRLHPSIIEHIGLVSAISSFCNELSDRPDLRINFIHEGVQRTLPKNISLCLFRIVQEGLRNVIKHSGATTARVELNGTPEELTLQISDWGRGFEPESDEVRQGLGLLSMRERLRIVGGEISFSQLEPSGTKIEAVVPLPVLDTIAGGQSR